MTAPPKRRWFRFGLRTLFFWFVPYVALVAWILSWRLPADHTPSDPLTMPWVKGISILAGTIAFVVARIIVVTLADDLGPLRKAKPGHHRKIEPLPGRQKT